MASTTQKRLSLGAAVLALCALAPNMALAQTAHSKVVLEETFRTPAPPNEAFPQNADHVFISTTVMFILALIFSVISHVDSRRFNSTVPRAMVLGAAFCVVPEAIDNYLAGCYWSQSHDPNKLLFFLMGREFDYYVAIMWWAFGAILAYLLYAVLLREVKTGTLWICLGLSGVADIIIEEILLGYGGIYTYFGHQPLVLIMRFPWWWLFSNVSSLFLSVSIAYRYREWFNGWKSVFILALMPSCYIGAFTLSAMPTIFVIQGDFSPLVTQLAGILSSVISIIQAGAMMHLILGRDPLAFSEAPQAMKLGNGTLGNGTLGNGKLGNGKLGNGVLHATPAVRKA
ncbi:hypothetical protein K432DRAFT_385197 [Lepidopterella palustris CBS 459.81]|uniref:EXPERA domain-containing protein n=1 Tax=Lepidopterella palustris CBS 459.81 TaxID=1314670 RepID=A0A8E2E3Q4_9PEZI|nr:hypothetical protein K432DRAFT_385197 [Lepidopterella palustris CBS 459.81]